ncbi:MAG: DedA family protein [Patescibacteria group bacterium]|jgi:membrane protein DedA with SNARE-associated domain
MIFSPEELVPILLQYKYFFLLPAMILEGPIITVVAGFLVSIGLLNGYLAYLIVVAGDLTGDFLYYAIGRYGRENFIVKWGKYIGITKERMVMLDDHYNEHAGKTMLAGKFLHGVGGVILASAGASKVPLLKFLWYNFIGTLPKSFLLMAIGYFFGENLKHIDSWFNALSLVSLGIAGIVGLYFLYGKKKSG